MTLREQFNGLYALGFCEAKGEDDAADKSAQYAGLLRLGVNAILAIQATGRNFNSCMTS